MAANGIRAYFETVRAMQEAAVLGQEEILRAVAAEMVRVIRADGRIFLFGTGHSHLLAEEGHLRAGGLAPVTPILLTGLMMHENPLLGSQIERTPGLAQGILARYAPQPGELLVIFSNSGVNRLPVEMAQQAVELGLTVVAVCSLAYARVAPLSDLGVRLTDVADFVLDNGGQPGDAAIPVPGTAWRTGPTSTVVGATLWNCLVTQTALTLAAAGETPPLYASFNMAGAREHDQALFTAWRGRNPHL